jgi:hypothetical protein
MPPLAELEMFLVFEFYKDAAPSGRSKTCGDAKTPHRRFDFERRKRILLGVGKEAGSASSGQDDH